MKLKSTRSNNIFRLKNTSPTCTEIKFTSPIRRHVRSPRTYNAPKRNKRKNVETERRYCSLTFVEATSVQTRTHIVRAINFPGINGNGEWQSETESARLYEKARVRIFSLDPKNRYFSERRDVGKFKAGTAAQQENVPFTVTRRE